MWNAYEIHVGGDHFQSIKEYEPHTMLRESLTYVFKIYYKYQIVYLSMDMLNKIAEVLGRLNVESLIYRKVKVVFLCALLCGPFRKSTQQVKHMDNASVTYLKSPVLVVRVTNCKMS